MNQEEHKRFVNSEHMTRMHRMVHQAAYLFAVDYLIENGGSVRDGVHAARMALEVAETKEVENSNWQNPMLTRRIDQALGRQQEKVRERILTGERLWIRSGVSTRWHYVATPTRAKCGTKINHDDKAWALTNDKPRLREICQRCEG